MLKPFFLNFSLYCCYFQVLRNLLPYTIFVAPQELLPMQTLISTAPLTEQTQNDSLLKRNAIKACYCITLLSLHLQGFYCFTISLFKCFYILQYFWNLSFCIAELQAHFLNGALPNNDSVPRLRRELCSKNKPLSCEICQVFFFFTIIKHTFLRHFHTFISRLNSPSSQSPALQSHTASNQIKKDELHWWIESRHQTLRTQKTSVQNKNKKR